MEGRREQLVFGGAVVLVGALSWMELGDRYEPSSVPAPKRIEAQPVELPAAVLLGPAAGVPPGQREESVFAPPRELLPLDPLQLPAPPLPPLSVRRPAEEPAMHGRAARAYRVPAESLGSLTVSADARSAAEALDDEVSDTQGSPPGADAAEPEAPAAAPPPAKLGSKPKPGAKPAGSGTAAGTDVVPAADGGVLEARHDWVARTDGGHRLYGTILNDDPIGLPQRPGEDLRFQQVSESSGRPLGAPFMIPRVEVVEFGLAATFENSYRLRSRGLGGSAGAAAPRRALALEMLAAWPAEPHALEFALAEARVARDAAPADPASLRLLALLLRRSFDIEGERALYREALDRGSADPALTAGYVRLVRDLGLRERAWELQELAQTLGRQTAEVLVSRALLLCDDGRWEDARAALDEAASLPFLGPLEDGQKRELALLSGEVQLALGAPAEGLREANRVLLDVPQEPRALILAGAAQAAQDALAPAAEAFAAALLAQPGNSRALTNAGIVAWRQRDGEEARRQLLRAVASDPYRAVAPALALGFLAEDAGLPSKARDAYQVALETDPDNAEALYHLGSSQRQDGDPDAAVVTLRQALRLAGPDVLVLLELGRASLDRALNEEALRYFREAERLEPDNAEVQWYVGLAALATGDTLGCRAPLEAATAGGRPGAHAALGVANYRRGDAEAALDHFDEVAKAYAGRPDDPQAVYAAAQAAAVRDNLSKRQWLDRFGRSALQRGWTEDAWEGSPRLILDGNRVVVSGRMEKPREDQRPGISRAVDGKAFFAVQAELSAPPGDTRAGLSLTYSQVKGAQGRLPKARLDIFLDVDGVVKLSALDNFETVVLASVPAEGVEVAPGAPVLLGIERVDDLSGSFAFSVDGRRVGEVVELKSLRNFKNPFDLQVWADAAPGREVSAAVSLMRIVQAP